MEGYHPKENSLSWSLQEYYGSAGDVGSPGWVSTNFMCISRMPLSVASNSAPDRLAHHAHIIMEGDSYRRKLSPKSSTPSTRRGVK